MVLGRDKRLVGYGKHGAECALDVLHETLGELRRCADECYVRLSDCIEFRIKPDGTRVSELDRQIEERWRDVLAHRHPDHDIVGEEGGRVAVKESPYCWYLDPLDGTDDFTRGIPLFGYIVSLTHEGAPVCALIGHQALGLSLSAVRGRGVCMGGRRLSRLAQSEQSDRAIALPAWEDVVRTVDGVTKFERLAAAFPNYRTYRNVYAHTAVILGAIEGGVEFDVAPWDIAGTQLMIEELGGSFVKFQRRVDEEGIERVGAAFGCRETVAEMAAMLVDEA